MKMLTDECFFGSDCGGSGNNVLFHNRCECKFKILVKLGIFKKRQSQFRNIQ